MIVYKPVFKNHWSIEEIDTKDLRIIGSDTVISRYGTLYNNNFYTTREAVNWWIAKEYGEAAPYRYYITNKSYGEVE